MFNKSLTIVLPVHNAESQLRNNVGELLEFASELTSKFGVLIIDDGSTDATFEVAEELAAHYPQVSVRRHRHSRGLGATMEYVKRRVRTDAVIVHDGVTPINSKEMRTLWRRWIDESIARDGQADSFAVQSHDASDFVNLSSLHSTMERVHRQVIGFQLMTPAQDATSLDGQMTESELPRKDASHASRRGGLGQIPALPRPKFLSTLAAFALGE